MVWLLTTIQNMEEVMLAHIFFDINHFCQSFEAQCNTLFLSSGCKYLNRVCCFSLRNIMAVAVIFITQTITGLLKRFYLKSIQLCGHHLFTSLTSSLIVLPVKNMKHALNIQYIVLIFFVRLDFGRCKSKTIL